MKNFRQNIHNFGGLVISTTLVLQPIMVQAQIQRSFLNPSFEQPIFGSAGQQCYVQVLPSVIPGWETTHGSVKAGTGDCSGYTSPGNVPLIEIWTSGFLGASTATNAGRQFAELNAEQASQLYQNLCLYKDETITFSLLHRGRSSTSTADVANFLIGLNTDPAATVFGKFSTTSNGTVTPPVAQNGATIPNVTNNNAGNGWVRYNGTVPYTGATGNHPVGFAAVSTAGGNNTIGNFLDDVQFAGKPVLEFVASSGDGAESETNPTTNPPKLRIVGFVPTGGIGVPISVGGTATLGTDFTTTSGTSNFNMTIPAGNYDGTTSTGSIFTIPFTVINNNIPQGVRTIIFTIQPSSSFFTSSTMTCGGNPIIISNYTIYDDDFISGKVWDDLDNSANNTFTNINTGAETGTNAGGLVYAILVDANNKVLRTTPVAADGTYTFLDVPLNQNSVKIILSTTAGTLGNTAPAPSLPSNWVNTSPLTTTTFNTGTNIANKDFGVEQLPNTNDVTAPLQPNPSGTNKVQVPNLSGTDPEDGNLGAGNTFKIVSLPTNGTLYYNNIPVVTNQIINNYDPTKLTLDPNDGAITVTFIVAAMDAGSKEDPTPATVTIQFSNGNSKLLLVKRITRINNQDLTDIVDGRSDVPITAANYVTVSRETDDNDSKWPVNYLRGLINAGTVKPEDVLEYTIYFLSSGVNNANNVRVCDLVPSNVDFLAAAFNGLTPNDGGTSGADQGIAMAVGSTSPTVYFSNVADSDRATFYPANDPATPSFCSGSNTNGAVVVDITRPVVLPSLPPATGSGTPINSYGFVRFRGKVR